MDPAHVESATKNTVRFALSRGYLTMDQLREALVIKEQLEGAGRSAQLLAVLASRSIRADHHPELSEYYQRQLAALLASPTGSAPPAPPARVELPTKLDAPADLLSRSVEVARRPPHQDSQKIQLFLRESERALQAQPAEEQAVIPDKVFVALAQKAGYPSKEDLLTCRRLQLERRDLGQAPTLFEIVEERRLLPERRVRRFRKWAAMVTRRDAAPLEAEGEGGAGKVVLSLSAASLALPSDVDGGIQGQVDPGQVAPGQVDPGRGVSSQASPAPAQPARPARARRAARALRESAKIVARGVTRRVEKKAREDPDEAWREALQLMVVAALLSLVVGLGLGMWLGARSVRSAPVLPPSGPKPSPAASDSPSPVGGGSPIAARDSEADRAWERLREVPASEAAKAYLDFTIDHPADPRAGDARRVSDLLDDLDRAGGHVGKRALDHLLKQAQAREAEDPRGARVLYDALRAAAPGTEAARAAGRLRRDLIARDPAAAGEPPLPAGTPPPERSLTPKPNSTHAR